MEELTKKQKWYILRKAKKMYADRLYAGMCGCIDSSLYKYISEKMKQDPHLYGYEDRGYDYLHDIFPEFNSVYLSGKSSGAFSYWWDEEDYQSRIKAFDTLIKLYK